MPRAKVGARSVQDVLTEAEFVDTALVRRFRTAETPPAVPQIDPHLWATYVNGTASALQQVPARFAGEIESMIEKSRKHLAHEHNQDLRVDVQWLRPPESEGEPERDRVIARDKRVSYATEHPQTKIEIRFRLRGPLNRGVRARQTKKRTTKGRAARPAAAALSLPDQRVAPACCQTGRGFLLPASSLTGCGDGHKVLL